MKNLDNIGLTELTSNELKNTEGGAPIVGLAAIAVGGGMLLGAFVLGAVVAYGVCKLLDKATR